MRELKCTNCGAPLHYEARNEYRCEHCGALYKVEDCDHGYQVIAVEHPQVRTFKAVSFVRQEDVDRYGEDFMSRQVAEKMKHSLAEQLVDFMRLERSYDPYEKAVMIRGTIRVVEPSFRF